MSNADISNSNCYFGLYSGSSNNVVGTQNVYFGYNSGANVGTSTKSTFIGANTSQTLGQNFTKSTAIGYGANVTASNQIVLGTASEYVLVPGALQVAGGLGVSGDIYCRSVYSNNVNLTAVSANTPHNIVLTNGTTGYNQLSTDYNADFTYNPATSVFKFANTMLDGSNNTWSIPATQLPTTSDNTNTTCYIPFTKSTATANPNQQLYVDDTTGPLTYNPSTSTISCNTASLNSASLTGTDPSVKFIGGTNISGLGYASYAGHYSASAAAGDLVLRGDANKKLIMQSGSGAGTIIIDGSNSILMQPGYTTPPTLTSSQIGYFAQVKISNITFASGALKQICTYTLPASGYYMLFCNLLYFCSVSNTTAGYIESFFGTSSASFTGRIGGSTLGYIASYSPNASSLSIAVPYLCTVANKIIYLNVYCSVTTPPALQSNGYSYISYMKIA